MTISVRELVRGFDGKRAVDGISFDVGEGEFFVLVGPSGCGKTTTLRLVAGLESTDDGVVEIGGRDVTRIRPRERDIAMVFQDYAIFPHLNVFENIAYGLRARGTGSSTVRERVPKAAEAFRIGHLLRRKPRQLSGGERQRVALARALVRDAQAYLFDEPLSNLDAQLRNQAREDILALHKRQRKPTIYVTHDQDEAMSMGDRIAVLKDGRVQQVGTGRELYEKPANVFVAFFIGTPSMNLFEGTLEDDRFTGAVVDLPLPRTLADRVRGKTGSAVQLGIRPEDLHSPRKAPFAVSEDNTVKAEVQIIEPTTAGSTVYLTIGDHDIAASFPSRLPDRYLGQEVPLAVDLEQVHLFDAETGSAL